MSSGWNLTEGYYDPRKILTEEDLNDIFSILFSNKSKNTTSYKYGFLKAILDNLYNVDRNLSISFTSLFSKFAESYWNLVLVYKLKQANCNACINKILYEEWNNLLEILNLSKNKKVIPFESLSSEVQQEIICKVIKECSKYVVGAVYADSNRNIYSFSKKSQTITLNPIVYQYMLRHKAMLEKVNYFEWAKFLHKINKTSCNDYIISLDCSTRRANLSSFRDILFSFYEDELKKTHSCFYCGKTIENTTKTHVDHFIPWSFVKDDKLWNLVLTCSDCNKSKNNKLPPEKKISKIIKRNHLLMECLNSNNWIDSHTYTDETIPLLYKVAVMNGFNQIWTGK